MNERMPIQVLNGIPGRPAARVRRSALPDYEGLGGLAGPEVPLPAITPALPAITTPLAPGTIAPVPTGVPAPTGASSIFSNINSGVNAASTVATTILGLWQNVENAKHDREMAERRLAADAGNQRYQMELQAKLQQEREAEAAWRQAQMQMRGGSPRRWLLFGGIGVAALLAVLLLVRSGQRDRMMMARLARQ